MSSFTGINYFLDSARTNLSGQLKVFYNFTGTAGSIIPSLPFGKTKYSGILSNSTNFYTSAGSGFFGGNTQLEISNVTGINNILGSNNNWTMVLNFELSGQQNGILFSSYLSGSAGQPNSGFILGINETCAPYIEYYSNLGTVILTSSNNFGSKNTIFITKTNNHVGLDLFNYNTKTLESESFNVNDNYFLSSNSWIIGGKSGAPSYFSGNKLRGWSDLFLYFSPGLISSQKTQLASGIYCDITSPAQQITSGFINIVTGAITGFVPIFSGTTGQAVQFYNFQTGVCNNINAVYQVTDLTGIVYDIGIIPLTRTITNYFTGITGGGPIENSGYSRSFGMDGITYLKDNNNYDLNELFYSTGINKVNFNNNLTFDRTVNQFVINQIYSLDQLNFYIDSVAQFGSGYSLGGDFYNPSVILSGMYFLSGNYLSGAYDNNDSNILDIVSGARNFSTGNYFINANQTGISGFYAPNSMIFLDGVKLKSGIDYQFNGTNFILNNSYWYGIMYPTFWTFPIEFENNYSSGISSFLDAPRRFARGTSQVFMNGVRQFIENDYQEISQFSPLNNQSNYFGGVNRIYNNSNDFIEYL